MLNVNMLVSDVKNSSFSQTGFSLNSLKRVQKCYQIIPAMLIPALPSFVGRAMENQCPELASEKALGLKLSFCLDLSKMHMQGKPPAC